jgi:ElaB/YqjD/DUF883 family membrane-anchored ribosome-binding protein
MMDRAVDEFERARGRMAGDFRNMITDSEDLLKAAATVSGEGFSAARSKFEEKLKRARTSLAEASQPVLDKASGAATATDAYVHRNAWTVVGVAVAAGLLIGFLTAKR